MKINYRAREYLPKLKEAGLNREERRYYFTIQDAKANVAMYTVRAAAISIGLGAIALSLTQKGKSDSPGLTQIIVAAGLGGLGAFALRHSMNTEEHFENQINQLIKARKEAEAGKIPTKGQEGTDFWLDR